MPRRSRIDAPGALHHLIVRGIERRAVFRDDADREKFIEKLGTVLAIRTILCNSVGAAYRLYGAGLRR